MTITDSELLERFARTNSEDAFAELVKRHVNLVYSTALRQMNGDEHLARDVAQTVFTDLARKANSLYRRESLAGWLYTSAYFAAAKIIRTENRRRDREERFMCEPANESVPDAEWEKIRPALDEAMHELKDTDREVLLLRYFENQQFAEVGVKLGINEDSARKRAERALEKLRAIFTERGLTTAGVFASVISANAVQPAPASVAAALTTTSIAAAGTGTFTLLKIMTTAKIKLGISAILLASAATALLIQHQGQQKLRDENGLLRQQIAQLQIDNEKFSNQMAGAADASKLMKNQLNELLKLRGEVGVLRQQIESRKEQANRPPALAKASEKTSHAPGSYISKDQLAFAGYATPEATIETTAWAAMKGTFEQLNEGLSPELLTNELQDTNALKSFYADRDEQAAQFKGIQILAKKTLAEDKVELKVKEDDGATSQLVVQPLVKIGDEWKFGGSTREYQDNWENDGQVQTFAP
jgi:RNA polymerase sigma factor (sigma-70 family)